MTNKVEQTTKMAGLLNKVLTTPEHVKRAAALAGLKERTVAGMRSGARANLRTMNLPQAQAVTEPNERWAKFWNSVLNERGLYAALIDSDVQPADLGPAVAAALAGHLKALADRKLTGPEKNEEADRFEAIATMAAAYAGFCRRTADEVTVI